MFKPTSATLSVLLLLAIFCIASVEAAPKQNKSGQNQAGGNGGGSNNNAGKKRTPRDKVMQVPEGISTTQDGQFTILDKSLECNKLTIRMKVSGPADQFKKGSNVRGAAADSGASGPLGLMVLLHGDGGQSFTAFPNQGVNEAKQMGVVLLAPNKGLQWGGAPQGNVERPNGREDADAVNDCIKNEIPKQIAFNESNVSFMGVSGGSQMLSGNFMPAHMGKYKNSRFLLSCGGTAPDDFTAESSEALSTTRIHFQSTFNELSSLQKTIPKSIAGFEKAATNENLSQDQINELQTVNNSPKGGHCAFDEKSFESGVQELTNNFVDIMFNKGNIPGIGRSDIRVGGNEQPKFGEERRQ